MAEWYVIQATLCVGTPGVVKSKSSPGVRRTSLISLNYALLIADTVECDGKSNV